VRSRLPLYILPLFVPLALLTARAPAIAAPWITSPGTRQHGLRLGIWIVCLLGIRLGLAAFPTEKDARRLYRALPPLGTAELIVNDTETHHGLAFYTQRDLEYVSGLGATPESVHSIPIEAEIAEEGLPGHDPHIYLVRRSESMALEHLLEKTHARVMDCGPVGALEAMRTVPVGVPHGGAGTSAAAGGGGGV
jgi:hypothetical protein